MNVEVKKHDRVITDDTRYELIVSFNRQHRSIVLPENTNHKQIATALHTFAEAIYNDSRLNGE